MCRFPYLALQLREDMRADDDLLGSATRIAARHDLRLLRIDPEGQLASFAIGMHLVATFAVRGCACDWTTREHRAMEALTRELLLATDVRRVRIGIWTITGAVERGEARRPLDVREVDTDALADLDWTTDVVVDVRRAAHPPFPTGPLRKVALGIDTR